MSNRPAITALLAHCFIAAEPSIDSVVASIAAAFESRPRWVRPLAARYFRAFDPGSRPRYADVLRFLKADRPLARHSRGLTAARLLTPPIPMRPVAAAAHWDLPSIESPAALADWLNVDPGRLAWFADRKGLGAKRATSEPLQHYHYKLLAKMSGSLRLIEIPKPRLKEMQRRILSGILDRIPPHPASHGFMKGRSIRSFAAPHTGRRVVLRMDLSDFFPSIAAARVGAFFRTAGYPEPVADLLTGLCTNYAPARILPTFDARALYRAPHLPQGAPTSPALANIAMYRADCRLAGLALSAGAAYTRYADDLAFSGDEAFDRGVERFSLHAAAILHEEGFSVHHRKTRIMRQSVRQHLAGLVTNQRVNIRRSDFDLLKAILTNCVRLGPASQNREQHADLRAHLRGRIAFVESVNLAKGARLRTLFDSIQWHSAEVEP